MIKGTRKIAGILSLATAFTLTAGVAFGLPSETQTASAERTSAWVTVDEIYNDDTSNFKAAELKELYQALAGVTTIVGLDESLQNDVDNALTSADFRENNGGSNNVSVSFGGMKWDAVYLTTAKNSTADGTQAGDIILDLWRSADELTSDDDIAVYSDWATNAIYTYSSNMYSTSRIRVETLNAGGQYSQSGGSTLAARHEQDENNQYARFTMDEVENSLTSYLAKPSEVGYQAKEWDEATAGSVNPGKYYFPNDTYDEPQGGEWYNNYNYLADNRDTGREDGAKYGSWKDDYLWLPSLTEMGVEDGNGNGIWDTDTSLRSAIRESYNFYWLRSGARYRPDQAYVVYDYGACAPQSVHNSAKVRPALHLNLTAAARTALPMKDDWKDDTKPYAPNGVEWVLENTENVTITPVEQDGGDTSWYDAENHTITADKVGEYKLKVKPTDGFQWGDGSNDEITVTYKVKPADMTVEFNSNGKLLKRQDIVYSSGMDPIELRLPDPTDEKFPISWTGVTWSADNKDKIKIQYIITTHNEAEHDDSAIISYRNELRNGNYADAWKDYDNLDDDKKTALKPMGYVVYFRAEDTEGNHNVLIDYFSIHIAAEELNITLTDDARTAFTQGVEYGDVSHDKTMFEKQIVGGIKTITTPDPEDPSQQIDRTEDFKKNIDNFTFYLRKDDSQKGDIYTIEDDGVHVHKEDSQRVDYLPLGTYYLYVAYTSPPESEKAGDYITFNWVRGRPSFTVSARKIKVTLTFTEQTYGKNPTDWVSVSAVRANGDENWYANFDADSADDFDILNLSYTLQETGAAPNNRTPASTYTVEPKWSNENYEVEFADESGGTAFTYTVNKREITVAEAASIAWTNANTRTYNGSPVTPRAVLTVDGNRLTLNVKIEGENGNDTFRNVDKYTFTADLRETDKQNYVFADGVTLTKEASIEAAELTLTWADKSFTYTGDVIGEKDYPTVTVSGRMGDDDDSVVYVKLVPDGEFKNAGSYTFTATLQGTGAGNYKIAGDNTHTYSISKATITVSGTYTDSREYNGEEYKKVITGSGNGLTVTMSPTDDNFKITITTSWKDANDAPYTGTIQEKDVQYDDANFTLVIDPAAGYSITITRASLTASLSARVEYGEELGKGNVTVSVSDGDLKNGDSKTAIEEKIMEAVSAFTFSEDYTPGTTHANAEGLTVSHSDTVELENYTVSFNEGAVTVNQRKITVTLTFTDTTYGDDPAEKKWVLATAVRTGGKGGDWHGKGSDDLDSILSYSLQGAKGGAALTSPHPNNSTPADTYTVTPTCTSGNYEVTFKDNIGGELFKYTVNKAKLTVKANDQTITYGQAPSLTNENVTITGFVNGEQQHDVVRGDVKLECGYNQYDNVGSGTFTITPSVGTLEADNYEFETFEGGKLTVERKRITAKAVPSGELTYGQDIQNSNFTVTFDTLVDGDNGKVTAVLTFSGTAYDGTVASEHSAPTHAGNSYTVTVTDIGGDKADNYILEGSTATSFEIKRATIAKPTAVTEEFTYNGNTQTYTLQGSDSTKYDVVGAQQTDANEDGYEVTVTLNDKNYMWADESIAPLKFSFIIKKKPIAVKWELKDWTGDSHAFEDKKFDDPTAKAETDIKDEGPFTLRVVRTSPDTDVEFKNVGSYTFEASFDPNDSDFTKNYTLTVETKTKTYNITAATTNGWRENLSLAGWTYDAGTKAHTPTATPIFGADTVKFTYYSDDEGKRGSLLGETQPKNAGTYWVVATVEATDNYNRIEAELKFTISPRRVDVDWGDLQDSYTYTGEVLGTVGKGGTITAKFAGQGDDGMIELEVTFEVKYNVLSLTTAEHEFKFAGTYTFTADFKSDATLEKQNYTLNSRKEKHVTVEQKSVSVEWSDQTFVYQGQEIKDNLPTATVDEKKVPLAVELQGDALFKNAGTYTFEATWDKNSAIANNYDISGTTHEFTIQKANLYVGVEATVEYGETTPKATLSYKSGLVGEDTEEQSSLLAKAQAAAEFDFGGYSSSTGVDQSRKLKVTVSGAIDNYNIVFEEGQEYFLAITQREITVTLTFKNHTYGEDPTDWVTPTAARAEGKTRTWYAPSGSSNISILKITYSLTGETYGDSLTAPTSETTADTYTVEATCGNENYKVTFVKKNAEGGEDYVVNKATLTGSVTWNGAGRKTYSGEPFADPTATIVGVNEKTLNLKVEQKNYDGKGNGEHEFKDAGTYTFTASLSAEDAKNYKWNDEERADLKKEVTITPAEVTITWGDETYTYRGAVIEEREYPTATVNGKKNAADEVYATVKTNKTFRNADTYTFTATLTGAAAHNYVIKEGNNSNDYTIGKATLTGDITWSGAESFTYDGTKHADPTATIRGVGTEDGENGVLTLEVTPSFSGDFKNANTYTFTASLSGDDAKNYDWGDVKQDTSVTISQKEIDTGDIDWVYQTEGYTYKGDAFDLPTASFHVIEGETVGLDVKMTKFNGAELEKTVAFRNAGEYTFEASITNPNYTFKKGADTEKNLTIGKYTVKNEDVNWQDRTEDPFVYAGENEKLDDPWAKFKGVGEDAKDGKLFDLTVSLTADSKKPFHDVGSYTFEVQLKSTETQNYELGSDVGTKTYQIVKADLEAKFGVGGTMPRLRDTVYLSDGSHAISLKMPEDTSPLYFIFHKGKSFTVTGLTVFYIVKTHEEGLHHDESDPSSTMPSLDDPDWKPFDELAEDLKEAKDTLGYTVYIKVTDEHGNYNDFCTWYGVHVAHEELVITLTDDAVNGFDDGFTAGVEYGDFNYTEGRFEELLKAGVESVTSNSAVEDGNRKEEFFDSDKIKYFTFYFRNGDGHIYYFRGDSIYDIGGDVIANLPVDTYTLDVAYTADKDETGEHRHIAFTWKKQSGENYTPQFRIVAREIGIDVTFTDTVYGEDPNAPEKPWVAFGDPTRTAKGKEGENWYATGEAKNNADLSILSITYEANGAAFNPTNRTDANTYTVTVKCGNGNYHVTFNYGDKQTYIVEQKKISVKITLPNDLTYGKFTEGQFSAQLTGVEVGDDVECVLTYSGTSYDKLYNGGSAAPTRAGENYKVVASLKGEKAGNYELILEGSEATFSIAKATVEKPAEDTNTYTYTGEQQTYQVTAKLGLYSVTNNVQTDANETGYEVVVHLEDGFNYAWEGGDSGDLTYIFKIMRKDLTVTADSKDITYGDAVPSFGVKYDGFVKDEDEHDLKGELDFDCVYKQYGDVGDYDITPKGYTSDNYNITFVAGTLKVERRRVTVTITEPSDLTYGGFDPEEVFKATFADGDIVNDDKVSPKLAFSGTSRSGKVFKDEPIANLKLAGRSYTVTATLDGEKAGNYILDDAGATTAAFEIKRATVTVEWSGIEASYTYQKTEPFALPTASAEGVGGDGTLTLKVDFRTSPSNVKEFQNAGDYVFVATIEDTELAFNYILQGNASETITVKKATVVLPTIDSTVYNGTVQQAKVSNTDEYTVYENNGGKDAGTYDVVLHLTHPENYQWAEGDEAVEKRLKGEFEIERKVVEEVTWEEKTYTYLGEVIGSDSYPTAKFTGEAKEGEIFLTVSLEDGATFLNAGTYTFKAVLTKAAEKNYELAGDMTHKYEIEQAEMVSKFDTTGKMSKKDHDHYFDVEMPPVELHLPDPTASEFPIVGVGKDTTWKDGELKIYYLVVEHDEYDHDDDAIKALLDELKIGRLPDGKEWAEYTKENADLNVTDPKGYCVYFMIVESEGKGNYETYYDYFSVHIAHEVLHITLTQEAKDAFDAKVEYGDGIHTQDSLRNSIVGGIARITDNKGEDRTEEFKDEKTKFTFYFRKDSESGQYYSVESEGFRDSHNNKVNNLPLGTYYLFVIYNGDAGGEPQRIIFDWGTDGRPYFEVIKRKVTIELTFTSHTYGDRNFDDWVKESARTRTTKGAADTNWFAPGEEDIDLNLRYALRGVPELLATTNARTYDVVTDYDRASNYEVTFVNAAGGDLTYTVKKATLTVTANDNTITYGEAPSASGVTIEGFVNGEGEDVLNKAGLGYDFGYEQYGDIGSFAITPKGLSADNYDFEYENGTLTVDPLEIEVEWREKSYTYTGSQFTELPTATAEGLRGDTFTLVVSPDFTGDFMNAGSYPFKAALDGTDAKAKNYTLKESTARSSYTVGKATVSAPTIASKVYDGTTLKAGIEDSALYTVEDNGGINAGDYEVTLTLRFPENYKWADSEESEIVLTFTIEKATYDMSGVTFEDVSVTYDGETHSITITGTLPDGVSVSYDGNEKREVGVYTVTAKFKGDAQNYELIPDLTAQLTILQVVHDLDGITFEDVTVKYDGEAHSIFITGTLPTNVTVTYENNGQIEPNVYTVTAVFHAPDNGEFARKTATLTILRMHVQAELESGSNVEVALDSEDGFDPTLEVVVEKVEDVERGYWAWERDQVSERYTVKLCKDGEEVPIDGKVTVRLLIPEELRDKNFGVKAMTRGTNIEFTRDGDYVVFEADGLSVYAFTMEGIPYLPILLSATGICVFNVILLVILAIVIKKNKKGEK